MDEFPLVLDNPYSGERFDLRTSARSGDGRFRFRWTLAPCRTGPPEHLHPDESESFTLVEGALEAWVDGRPVHLERGVRVTIPAGSNHRFRNPGPSAAVVEVDLDGPRLEDTIAAEAAYFGGRVTAHPRDLVRVALHDVTYGASRFRSPVVRWTMALVARVGRLVGFEPFPRVDGWASRIG